MSFKATAISLSVLLFASILPYSNGQSLIKINEVVTDDIRDFYVFEVRESNIPESQNKLVSVEIICKNNQSTPSSCWSLESFKLLDAAGRDYEPSSELSDLSKVRIAADDTIRSIVSFVMTSQATPTQLIFDESPSEFKIDLAQSKRPKDTAPQSAWILTDNTGKKVGDGVREIAIISEIISGSQLTFDIIMKNIGYKEIDYDFRKFYLKDEKGFVYSKPILSKKDLRDGILQPGELVKGNISFEIKYRSENFMVVYDKSPSFLSTGDSMKKPEFKVPRKGIIVNTDKTFYTIGEVVKINGNVSEAASIAGSIFILNPDKEVYTIEEFYPNPDRSFVTEFELKEDRLAGPGIWTVKVVYLTDIAEAEYTVLETETWISMGIAYTLSALVVSEPKLVDENGHGIHTVELNSVVGIQSEVSNTSSNEMTFTFIVQIKNEDGVTESIMLVGDLSVLPNDSAKVELSWSPHSYGEYQAEVFVWRSLGNPVPLTPVNRIGFGVPVKSIEGSVEISVRVSQSSDDAEESISSSRVNLESTDLELVNDLTEPQIIGMRFQSVQIPQGSTIVSARIYFEVDEVDTGQTDLKFHAEDVDDAPSFTKATNDISSRTKTTSSVDWNNARAWNVVEAIESTPDLSPIIQEVVDRPGWSDGNSIVIIVTGSGERTAESYNGDPDGAPLLVVNYTE